MTDDHAAKREEQLTTAPKADASDAEPRIDVTETDSGTKRIDVRDDAKYRPGKA
ncbi:multidrug transporter [Subtercola sp. YIM 133946]|uniref:multidrug transporter n=1 Tax=Subtercola sp. YIM 133946 TaxID=3118909 RepID=UPI002F9383CA